MIGHVAFKLNCMEWCCHTSEFLAHRAYCIYLCLFDDDNSTDVASNQTVVYQINVNFSIHTPYDFKIKKEDPALDIYLNSVETERDRMNFAYLNLDATQMELSNKKPAFPRC